jgi:hypothetical protein
MAFILIGSAQHSGCAFKATHLSVLARVLR